MKIRKTNLKLHYNPKTWELVFILFPIISPTKEAMQFLLGNGIGNYVMYFLRLWNIGSILLVLVKLLKRKKMETGSICMFVFCGVLVISTLFQGGANISYMFRILGSMFILFILSDTYKNEQFKYYLQAMYYTLTLINVFTAITIFFYYPSGMGQANRYLYGLDNLSYIYAFHGFAVGFIYNLVIKNGLSLSFLLSYAFVGLAYLYVQCGTAIIVIFLSVILVVFYKRNFIRKVNYKITMIVCMACFLFFVIVQNFNIVEWILLLIGKDATLNGRTRIWEVGWSVIQDHFILGIGITDSLVSQFLRQAGLGWTADIGHMHNIVLEIMIKGGLLAISVFIVLWSINYSFMMKYKNNTLTSVLCVLIIFSWLICMFEFRITVYSFWYLLILSYHIEDMLLLKGNGIRRYSRK